jgi:hypothetical protein
MRFPIAEPERSISARKSPACGLSEPLILLITRGKATRLGLFEEHYRIKP